MEYRELSIDDIKPVVELWNDNIGALYPMDVRFFKQNFENDRQYKKILGAMEGGKLAGLIIYKQWTAISGVIQPNTTIGYINSLIVDMKYRHSGVGTKLLELAERELESRGVKKIYIGSDTFHFFPGIPSEFIILEKFLTNKGYEMGELFYDVICDISRVELEKLPNMKLNEDERYKVVTFNYKDKEDLLGFFRRCFSGRWYQEIIDYFDMGVRERDIVVLKDNNKIIGFARIYDKDSTVIGPGIYWRGLLGDNYGGLGPIGIDADYRKQGLGLTILYKSLEILKSREVEKMVIDWNEILDFYGMFNFMPWKVYKRAFKKLTN